MILFLLAGTNVHSVQKIDLYTSICGNIYISIHLWNNIMQLRSENLTEGVCKIRINILVILLFSTGTFAQTKALLQSLERPDAGISLHVNAHKTEYICFNQTGDISILKGCSLKLVDKFPYQGCSVSSTETDLTDKIKRSFSKQQSCRYCSMDIPHGC